MKMLGPNLGVSAQRGRLCEDTEAKPRSNCTKRGLMCRYRGQTSEYLHKKKVNVQIQRRNPEVTAQRPFFMDSDDFLTRGYESSPNI
ncbi:hypothetical protein AB990_00870 [Alkalihalobacillus pseudalcaliphilus]|nr:hypothetical protein AB990_00870 [Alkalihalobacillus pseudalcaliphilus]